VVGISRSSGGGKFQGQVVGISRSSGGGNYQGQVVGEIMKVKWWGYQGQLVGEIIKVKWWGYRGQLEIFKKNQFDSLVLVYSGIFPNSSWYPALRQSWQH
jgi:hypothetical protein